jgi:hypothetical protein
MLVTGNDGRRISLRELERQKTKSRVRCISDRYCSSGEEYPNVAAFLDACKRVWPDEPVPVLVRRDGYYYEGDEAVLEIVTA